MTLLLVFVSWFFRLSVCVCVQAYVYTKNKQNQKERRKGDTTDELIALSLCCFGFFFVVFFFWQAGSVAAFCAVVFAPGPVNVDVVPETGFSPCACFSLENMANRATHASEKPEQREEEKKNGLRGVAVPFFFFLIFSPFSIYPGSLFPRRPPSTVSFLTQQRTHAQHGSAAFPGVSGPSLQGNAQKLLFFGYGMVQAA